MQTQKQHTNPTSNGQVFFERMVRRARRDVEALMKRIHSSSVQKEDASGMIHCLSFVLLNDVQGCATELEGATEEAFLAWCGASIVALSKSFLRRGSLPPLADPSSASVALRHFAAFGRGRKEAPRKRRLVEMGYMAERMIARAGKGVHS